MATVDMQALRVEILVYVAEVDILVIGYPIIRMIYMLTYPHAAAAVTPKEWVIVFTEFLCTSLILYYLKRSVSSFFITLLNDSERRLSEAEHSRRWCARVRWCSSQTRCIWGGRPNRRGVESYSKVLVDVANPLGTNGHPEVVLFADKVVDEQLYQDEVCAQQRNVMGQTRGCLSDGYWHGEDFGDHDACIIRRDIWGARPRLTFNTLGRRISWRGWRCGIPFATWALASSASTSSQSFSRYPTSPLS